MNKIYRGILLLAVSLSLSASLAFAVGDFNPEDPSDRDCDVGTDVTTTDEQVDINTGRICVTTDTTVLAPGQSGIEECLTTSDTACTDFFRFVGCFAPETKILMADKKEKEARLVREGDMVWNPLTEKAMKVAKMVGGPEKPALLEIGYGDVVVHVTEDHAMFVQKALKQAALEEQKQALDFEVKRADQVTTADLVLGADKKFHQVTVARKLPLKEGQIVLNFALETEAKNPRKHAVAANGIITGDLTVQESLKEKSAM